MQDTAGVPRASDGQPPAGRPLVDDELADQLLGKAQAEGADLLGPDGLLSQVTKAVLERALAEEMTGHLGYDKHDPAGRGSGNNRNGSTGKTVLTDIGAVDLAVPRDRNGTFEPQIVREGQTRLNGFNERIIALYAQGMTTRDIRAHLREMYDVEVSPDLISRVTARHAAAGSLAGRRVVLLHRSHRAQSQEPRAEPVVRPYDRAQHARERSRSRGRGRGRQGKRRG